MKVLSVASEVYPLVKTGGLADVAGALPGALARHGVDMRTLLPGYPAVMARLDGARSVHRFDDLLGETATLQAAEAGGIALLVLDCPALYDRDGGPYVDATGRDYPDNWKRFAALSLAAARIAEGEHAGFVPDLVHAHDWQAALTPVYLRYRALPEKPSVLTIHNIAFQGQFGFDIFAGLDLPPHAFSLEGLEYYGDVGFLKGGLQTASAITTVSPSYADEIRTPEFGMGLEGVISARVTALSGIVNGIDTGVWDPAADPALPAAFSATALKGRAESRRALAARFHLAHSDGPIFGLVSRLTWQKGIDLVAGAVDDLVAAGGQLVVLGSGDAALEGALLAARSRHPGHVGMQLGYDEPLSHLIQAGSDFILVPSRFEPCGLTQLYALRYGAVPLVGRTGGLADTVIDANHAALQAGVATGIQFAPITPEAFRTALRRAFDLFGDRKAFTRLQKQGLKSDVSWDRSAERYAALYARLTS